MTKLSVRQFGFRIFVVVLNAVAAGFAVNAREWSVFLLFFIFAFGTLVTLHRGWMFRLHCAMERFCEVSDRHYPGDPHA